MKISSFILIVCALSDEIIASTTIPSSQNSLIHQNSSSTSLTRNKRFLVYPGGGFARWVMGFLVPTDIPLYQNINALRNLQCFYPLPPNWVWRPLTWPGFGLGQDGRSFDDDDDENVLDKPDKPQNIPDSSRKIAYEVVEEMLTREGKDGRMCMLRAICEVAETPVNHNGIVGEFMQVFFTPGEHEPIDNDYRMARKAGLHHVDCEKLYPECPMGHGILDSISHFQESNFFSMFKF